MQILANNRLITSFFNLSAFGLNWVDLLIIAVFLFYAVEGYALGFVAALLDLISFVASFALALKFYTLVSTVLVSHFSLQQGFAKAIGFFAVAFISELLLSFLLRKLIKRVPSFVAPPWFHRVDHFLGIIPGIFSAVVLLSFLLTLIVALPLSPFIKHGVGSAKLGTILVANSQGLEKNLNNVFGEAVNETMNFLTVEPQSNESVKLHFTVSNATVDTSAEQEMFVMVNHERTSRGLPALIFNNRLRDVARAHSDDMFKRGYFSHYTPEGLSPFDRMGQADIQFSYAGENLALAPNVTLAMQGLMQSPGHKANILSPNFKKVGIGVMDGGVYGEMFSQEFTD
ncbi:MAG TPA: CvpA family protein [Candidatus Saccharimonadales bacterium]|nr:CvpA family protein [Candidatus Saccharimonadales bacterium]